MQIRPLRLASVHIRVALRLADAGQRKRAFRKLRQARRALAGLPSRRFQVARGLITQCLKLLKLQDSELARRAGRRAVRALSSRRT